MVLCITIKVEIVNIYTRVSLFSYTIIRQKCKPSKEKENCLGVYIYFYKHFMKYSQDFSPLKS